MEPPPPVTSHATSWELAGLSKASRNSIWIWLERAAPTKPAWPSPWMMVATAAGAAWTVALKLSGEFVKAPEAAVTVFAAPIAVPTDPQVPARPWASVVAEVVCTLPPPAVTAKVTATSATGSPPLSFTRTMSGAASCWPAPPVWLLPETTDDRRGRVVRFTLLHRPRGPGPRRGGTAGCWVACPAIW